MAPVRRSEAHSFVTLNVIDYFTVIGPKQVFNTSLQKERGRPDRKAFVTFDRGQNPKPGTGLCPLVLIYSMLTVTLGRCDDYSFHADENAEMWGNLPNVIELDSHFLAV